MKFGLNRKRTIGVIAAGVLLATLGGGIAFAVGGSAVTAATPPSDGGLQANGSYIDCVRNTSTSPQNLLHVVYVPNNGTHGCPAGWTQRNLAAAPQYGIALLNISRGGAAATTWGSFTTTLGSPAPMGDQATGNLRMSCSAAQAPCVVSLKAYATKAGVKDYPRINIDSTDFNAGGPEVSCEYVDGTDNNGGSIAIGNGAANATTVPLGVGGSLDCNEAQTLPADGVVNSLALPEGRYNFTVTNYFQQ